MSGHVVVSFRFRESPKNPDYKYIYALLPNSRQYARVYLNGKCRLLGNYPKENEYWLCSSSVHCNSRAEMVPVLLPLVRVAKHCLNN